MLMEIDMLSGYRLMWLSVMFDLPTITRDQRKTASRFRLDLKDLGFEMAQLSVYMRYCTSAGQMQTIIGKIEKMIPPDGKVKIIQFTDKQYEKIISFSGVNKEKPTNAPHQLQIF